MERSLCATTTEVRLAADKASCCVIDCSVSESSALVGSS